MAKTLLEIQTQVRQLIGDYQQTTFSEAAIIEAINWSQDLIMRIKGFKIGKRVYSVGSVPTGTLPSDLLAIKRVQLVDVPSSLVKSWYNPVTTDLTDASDVVLRFLDESTLQQEDAVNESWQSGTSFMPPRRWALFGNQEFVVIPVRVPSVYSPPEGYVTKVRLHFVQKATALELEDDTVDAAIPDYYQEAIRYAAVAYLMEKDTDLKSQQLKAEMMKSFMYHMEGGVPPLASTEVDS